MLQLDIFFGEHSLLVVSYNKYILLNIIHRFQQIYIIIKYKWILLIYSHIFVCVSKKIKSVFIK